MAKHNALLVVGSGPGIGRNTAALFAARGYSHVILLSRNASRLSEDAEFVKQAAPSARVDTLTVDLSDLGNVRKSLTEVEEKLEESKLPLEAVLYNAARVGVSKIGEWKVEDLEEDLKISVSSLYVVASWAMPRLVNIAPKARPAFLVTSGMLWKDPFPHLFSLSACKAAQHNFVRSMFKQYSPQDVHCGLVVVGGIVNDNAKLTTAKNVAEEFWKLYMQDKNEWTVDLNMVDPDYEDMIGGRQQSGQVW